MPSRPFYTPRTEEIPPPPRCVVDKQRWEYQYDAIGNRTAMIKGTTSTASDAAQRRSLYAAPAGSPRDGTQYGTVTHPSLVDISGYIVPPTVANANAVTVRLGGQTESYTGTVGEVGSYYREFNFSGTAAQWVATTQSVGTGASQATANGWFFFRGTNEALVYDDDGDLTQDARWTYEWDAENRLISMEENANIVRPAGAPARVRLTFGYDAYSRRLFKKTYQQANGSTTWQPSAQLIFVYDGWNLVAELDAMNKNRVLRRYLWGPDLSGTMSGAGGVGGLLFAEHTVDKWSTTLAGAAATGTSVRYQAQSDGNGNIMGLMAIDGNSHGKIVGRFDYDAFGNRVTNTLPAGLDACPIGFSSKYLDVETGLNYYGYRYYSPELGRWTARDPFGSRQSKNLYGFCFNNGINYLDSDGRQIVLPAPDPSGKGLEPGGSDSLDDGPPPPPTDMPGPDPQPGTGGPGGTEKPNTGGVSKNCVGDSCKKPDWINWPKNQIPKGCVRVPCGGIALNKTRCKCSESEVISWTWNTSRLEVNPQTGGLSFTKGEDWHHMIGREIPSPMKSVPWHTKLGRGNEVESITDPDAHFTKYYPNDVKYSPSKECYCCDPSKMQVK